MSLMGDGREYAIWLDLLMPALQEESVKAEQTARLFHSLLVEIENNPQGSLHAIECLETALAVAFSFTPIYPTSHILFQASLDEDFLAGLDSTERLMEAMRRVKAELKRDSRSQPKTSRRRKG